MSADPNAKEIVGWENALPIQTASTPKSLSEKIRDCKDCQLHPGANPSCTKKVIAGGSADPQIIVIGEAPGFDEDREGRPFVGECGAELRKKLDPLNIPYCLLNAVKCRPPNNRTPSFAEVKECSKWLRWQLDILTRERDPLPFILLVGKTAKNAVAPLASQTATTDTEWGKVFPIMHPGAILREPGLRPDWDAQWNKVRVLLGFPTEEKQPFCHLHVHTHYSRGDSINRVPELVKGALKKGFEHLALTDHYTMQGIVEFYYECRKNGINPILGIEANFAKDVQEKPGHLTVLALSYKGLKNIFKMVALSFQDSIAIRKAKAKVRPPILLKHLLENNEDVVACTACLGGYFNLNQSDKELMMLMRDTMVDRFYFEVMPTKVAWDNNIKLLALSEELKIPLVATNDVHYLNKEDEPIHKTLVGITQHKKITENFGYGDETFWLKTWDEMISNIPQAQVEIMEKGKAASISIAKRANIVIPDKDFYLPLISQTPDSTLASLLQPEEDPIYQARIEKELSVIRKRKVANYFLLVHDIFTYLKSKNVFVECRGSVAGSLIAYRLGWTDVDPVRCDIIFERFLSLDRLGLPDVDIDIDVRHRYSLVTDYLVPKYGADCVAFHTIQPSTFGVKSAVRDVARVHNLGFGLSSVLMNRKEELVEVVPEEVSQEIYNSVKGIVGQIKTYTPHAAAVIVTDKPVWEYAPVEYRQTPDSNKTAVMHVGTSFEDAEKIGLVKFDLLKQDSLAVLQDCTRQILEQGKDIAYDEEDFEVWREFGKGMTAGIFQFESDGMKRLLMDIKPKTVGDIADITAIHRPGPMESGIMKDYVEGKGDPILKEWCHYTRNCIIYQEQVMAILHGMGGFPMEETNGIQKAISKKLSPEKIEAYRKKFVDGAANKGYSQQLSNSLFDKILHFAKYAFNKAHSFKYAMRAFKMMWLKVHYPGEFLVATMRFSKKDVRAIILEMKQKGIRIEDPDINFSQPHFSTRDGVIYGALKAIDGIGPVTAQDIVNGQPYKSYSEIKKVVSSSQLLALAKARALRSIISSHAKAVQSAQCDGSLTLDCMTADAQDAIVEYTQETSLRIRNSVVDFPSTESIPDAFDTSRISHRIKYSNQTQQYGSFRILGNVVEAEKMFGKYNFTIEDGMGELDLSMWASGETDITSYIGQPLIVVGYRTEAEFMVVEAYPPEKLVEQQFLQTPVWGKYDPETHKISGDIIAYNTYQVKHGPNAGKEMATVIIENETGGGKITFFAPSWEKVHRGVAVGKPIRGLPVKCDNRNEYIARI